MPQPDPKKNDHSLPLISVVTVSFNAADALESTIQSVLDQSYPHLEHIVIDGGSSDRTLDVIQQYKEYLTYWISEPDQGIYDGINKGLRQARGELVNVLNGGDAFVSGILNEVGERYRENPFTMAACCYFWVYPKHQLKITPDVNRIGEGDALCHQAVFYQRHLHEEFGEYDWRYSLAADYYFMRRVYDRYGIVFIDREACYYHLGGASDLAFIVYADQVRQICHHLNDNFWKVEWVYWYKYMKFCVRKMLQYLRLDAFLFLYRWSRHKNRPSSIR